MLGVFREVGEPDSIYALAGAASHRMDQARPLAPPFNAHIFGCIFYYR